jgi:hypothetical protein|tara:strand:+ start:44 stop:1240 length:1197 start_codon:yes stop_codon:yes gene_type:complete
MVKMVTTKPNWSKSHPLNKLVLMYDAMEHKLVYADHYENTTVEIDYPADEGMLIDDWKVGHAYSFAGRPKYCADILNYWMLNKPLEHIQWDNFYDQDDFTYYYPLDKMIEQLCEKVSKYDSIYDDRAFMKFHDDFKNAFGELEKNGIGVNTDFTQIFGAHMLKYIHNKKIYQNYNFFTTTSRPSNSIHHLNFAALTPDMRKAFSPLNDVFLEFDFASYHPRLIAKLIDYDFGNSSVYGKLAEDLNVTESEAKTITFQNLYGGVRKDIAKMSEFFRGVENLVTVLYDEYMTRNRILSHIYKRPMKRANLGDLNAQKLFNYYIQSYETERNVVILNKLHTYLLEKKTNIVHYNYDSFLFDYAKEDGKETIHDIQNILQEDDFIIHSKVGNTYGTLKNYEF